ncbi:ATP-binding protein [Streptomyces sp. LBL]|uniref:ATP-binding protein n=1 Tax=Streptomyces sp. LBL TaxID=2940562 RepID=UPI002475242E|nr:ATP-binding protein [Streptomyces sp. LBL]
MPRSTVDALVGRDRELELLRSFVDQVLGRGGVLLLSGEPGVGKSVLLDTAAEAATAAGALVLRSVGVEFLGDLGFPGLNRLLEPLLHECDGLDPAHREALTVALGAGDGASVDRLVVHGAVPALLRWAASRRATKPSTAELARSSQARSSTTMNCRARPTTSGG